MAGSIDLIRVAYVLLFVLLSATGFVLAQEPLPEGISQPDVEPSSLDTLMERTGLGNAAQAAMMQYGSGARDLKEALKLSEKIDSMTDPDEKSKTEEKIAKQLSSAERAFREALSYNAGLIEAYAGLGTALRLQGKTEDALQVHAMALRRDPGDIDPADVERLADWVNQQKQS